MVPRVKIHRPTKRETGVYVPGDVLPTGEIVMSEMSVLVVGICFVTRAQAKAARRYGWMLIDGTSEDGYLVRIRRRVVGFNYRQ